jgi:hypothetical protein
MPIAFDPWIGPLYDTEGLGGTRLLLLGESQYPGPKTIVSPDGIPSLTDASATTENVEDLALKGRNRFFTKVILGLGAGQWISDERKAGVWQRVAFYNFVQQWLSGSRCRPTEQMWLAARGPLLDVIDNCRPHLVVVLGVELANHLPEFPEGVARLAIKHPSSRGFRYDPWSTQVAAAIDRARPHILGMPDHP